VPLIISTQWFSAQRTFSSGVRCRAYCAEIRRARSRDRVSLASGHHLGILGPSRAAHIPMQRALLSGRGSCLRHSFSSTKPTDFEFGRMWISTLVPERLRTTDLLDISGMTEVNCALDGSAERPARLRYTTRYETQKRSTVPFPSGTRGFLYCHVPDRVHPVATEIRFRLASGAIDDPQSAFALGEDLLLSPEIPWRIHMMSLARRSAYTFLATLLLQDGLVSQEVMDHWTNVKMPVRLNQKTPVLCRLNQPFVCRLDSCDPFLYVADKLDVHPVRAKSLMRDNRPTSKGLSQSRSPYSGVWRIHRRVHY
jgi:hypothetical protein